VRQSESVIVELVDSVIVILVILVVIIVPRGKRNFSINFELLFEPDLRYYYIYY